MSLMFQPLKKYAEFTGRARRSEYWLFTLFIFLVEIAYLVLFGVLGGGGMTGSGQMNGLGMALTAVYALFALGILIPSLAVSFRRLHDTDRSAWWLLIALIPFIGGLVLFVFTVLPGTTGANKYGADPKGGPTADTAAVFS